MINKFGLSDSLIDAARKVMAGEKVEEEPKADDQPKEEQQLDEGMSVHLSMNKDGKSYTVKKEKTGGRLKKGETVSDTHVDDLKDSGVKVHHEEAEPVDELSTKTLAKYHLKSQGDSLKIAKKYDRNAGTTHEDPFAEILYSKKDKSKYDKRYEGGETAKKKLKKKADYADPSRNKSLVGRSGDTDASIHHNMKRSQMNSYEPEGDLIDEEMFWDFDIIAEMSDAEFDEILETMTDEEILELQEGLLGAIGRGVKKVAGATARAAGRGVAAGAKKAAYRVSVSGRADAAEKKQAKLTAKTDRVAKVTADRKRLASAKAGGALAKQKLKAAKVKAKQVKAGLKSKDPVTAASAMASEALDPVGQEDDDVDNDGDPNDPNDKYLKKKRKAVSKAIAAQVKESKDLKTFKRLDEISREKLGQYQAKASDAKGHKKLSTKKVDNRYAGVAKASKKMEEAAPMATAKQQSGVDRIRRNIIKKKGQGVQNPLNLPSKPLDKAATYSTKKADRTPNFATKVKRGDVKEDTGEESVRSSKQSAALAKHYYMKAKGAQDAGNKEASAKYMAAAKKFYRKGEGMEAKEKEGRPEGAAEGLKPVDFQDRPLGVGEDYFNELEIEQIMAADEDILEVRVTKAAKDEPEHIAMQLRKVTSLRDKHAGVQFDGSNAKVDAKTAHAALNRYNSAKSGEKEELQRHMAHSHDALKHVASGGSLDKSPAAKKSRGPLFEPIKKSDHYN